MDMSSPEGVSVNDGICESPCSLSYMSILDGARGVAERSKESLMAKVDIQNAYRVVPVHPEDRWLMGMSWQKKLYIDTALPFGLRSAPKIFTALADAIEWIARRNGAQFVIHYLDDSIDRRTGLSAVLRVAYHTTENSGSVRDASSMGQTERSHPEANISGF